MEKITLVDENDCVVGGCGKSKVHEEGLLHRAFSIFVFDENRLLLQQRAIKKYHSGGLWTNTCCGHPRYGEALAGAAHRRLMEEMSFDCVLTEKAVIQYKALLDHNMVENEIDHIFVGSYNGKIIGNPDEVESYQWTDWEKIIQLVESHPEQYTYWFKICVKKLVDMNIMF